MNLFNARNKSRKLSLFIAITLALPLTIFTLSNTSRAANTLCRATITGSGTVTDNSTSTLCQLLVTAGSSTFTVPSGTSSINLLVIGGGGGGGGASFGGGGGAGLLVIANSVSVTPGATHAISVGTGGSGGAANATSGTAANGGNTTFGSLITADGGGGGTNYNQSANQSGASGGSGGGAGEGANSGGTKAGGASTRSSYSGLGTAYGNAGGTGSSWLGQVAAGGGGAGAAAASVTTFRVGTAGGAGLAVAVSGTGTFSTGSGSYYAAGGGGGSGHCCDSVPGAGGTGGGGVGADWRTGATTPGNGSTAGSGGGGAGAGTIGGNGAAGLVYITFAAPPTPYTITFNANGGTGTQTASSWTAGDSATVLPDTSTITRTAYTFAGWATSASSTTPVRSYSTAANVIFYAIWTRNAYAVTFNKNSDTATGTMAIETRTAATALPSNTFTWDGNHTFLSWNTAANGTGTQYLDGATYQYVASTTLYAQWGNTISYSNLGADSGSPSRSSDSWTSGAISLPTVGTMVKAGYSFGGWSNGVTTYTSTYTPTTGITLNPVWTPYTYTVKFNKNGVTASGTVPSDQTWAESTTALTLSGNTGSLVRTGYTFGGWATSASAPQTAITTFSSTSTTLVTTLYAIWTPVSYTVTYSLNSGTSTLPTESNKNINGTFTVAAAATRDSYVFGGWSDGTSIYAAGATYTVGSANVTLTAQWIPLYTVHYVMNGSATTPTADTTTVSGTVITLASAPTRTGYTFGGWVDNLPTPVVHAAGTSFSVIQDSTLQARWTPVDYTVTYALASGTSTLPTQASVNINTTFIIAGTPTRAGYSFGGWSDGTNTYGAGATYTVGSSNITLTAQWSAISYSVTYDLSGGVGTRPTHANVNIGATFTVSTVSDPTWIAHTFLGWSDGTSRYASNATYTAGAGDITLTAVWELNGYTRITYAINGGSGTLPTQAALLEGSYFALASGSALTKNGYVFAGWNDGSDTFQPAYSYYVGAYSSPITLTAQWDTGYSTTYVTETGTGTAPVDATYRAVNATFALANGGSLSKSGYTFAGWNDGTADYAGGATYTVGSANMTFTAVWTVAVTPPAPTPTPPVVIVDTKTVVLKITKETKSTESLVVDGGIKAINDRKSVETYFVIPPTKSPAPVIKPIAAENIKVISPNTSVNTQGVATTSDKPAVVPISLKDPIVTDEAAKTLSAKVIVSSSASDLTITAVNGFTGVVIVPVVATIDGVQTTVLNRVVVSPVLPIAEGFAPVDIGKSSISWGASTSQVVTYEVAVNGKIACTTPTTTCPLPALIGPKTKVTVNAIGNDQTQSGPQVIPYVAKAPIPALKVNFPLGSAVLTAPQKNEIAAISKVINTQGFTRLVVNGFTDSTGSPALNAALSKARAQAVVVYMKTLLPKVSVKAGANGPANPIADNASVDGRAQNRRTEIATW